MKLLIACLDDKSFEYRTEVDGLKFSQEYPYFSVPCVIGDDWLQRYCFRGEVAPVDVRQLDDVMFVLYAGRNNAQELVAWFPEAAAAVRNGYHTMRG